jgi:hypothetical protein
MDTIVCDVPVVFDPEQAAGFTGLRVDSSYFQELVEAGPVYLKYARPKAVLRWVDIDHDENGKVSIGDHQFESLIVNEKLSSMDKAFVYVATAGTELEDSPIQDSMLLKETLMMYSLVSAITHIMQYVTENFGYSEPGTLNPGSLPDWPIENNFALFDLLGPATDAIDVSIMDSGYMRPWKSASGIIFANASGYLNCILCKKLDCIGRRAEFDEAEYNRIFQSA